MIIINNIIILIMVLLHSVPAVRAIEIENESGDTLLPLKLKQ